MKLNKIILLFLSALLLTVRPVDAKNYNTVRSEANLVLACKDSQSFALKLDSPGCAFNIEGVSEEYDITSTSNHKVYVYLEPGQHTISSRGYNFSQARVSKWLRFSRLFGKESYTLVKTYSDKIVELQYAYPDSTKSKGRSHIVDLDQENSTINEKDESEGLIKDLYFKEIFELGDKKKQVSFETQQISYGTVLTLERERTVEHTVTIKDKNSSIKELEVESGALARLIGTLKIEIKREIEKNLNQTFSDKETYKTKIELDGNISSRWKIYWYDKIYRGIAKFEDRNGKVYEFPYKFRGGSEIKVIPVNGGNRRLAPYGAALHNVIPVNPILDRAQ